MKKYNQSSLKISFVAYSDVVKYLKNKIPEIEQNIKMNDLIDD